MEKQHNFLKVIIILVAMSMVLGVNAIYLLIVKDDNNFGQIMLNNLVEIIIISGIIFVWAKVFPRIFPATSIYSLKKPTIYQVMTVLGIVLINLIVLYRLLYMIRGGEPSVTMISVAGEYNSKEEFLGDMMASIHAVFIAPVIEEMGFRIIPASVIQTKKRRIVTLAILIVLFAAFHPKNFWVVLVDATVTCILFLFTNNSLIPILFHMFGNFLKTIAVAAAYYGIIDLSMADGGGTIFLFSFPVSVIVIIIGVILVWPMIFHSFKSNKKIEE